MNKQLLVILLISIAIILIPALLISLGLFFIIGHFWALFLATCGIIWIIGELSNRYYQRRINLDIQNVNNKLEELKSEQSITASCAFCKERITIPIRLNQRNTYACPKCKQVNLVIFQFTTAQVSTPLELPQLGETIPIPPNAFASDSPTIVN